MKHHDITIARVYLTESSKALTKMLAYLKTEAKVKGITIFRGIYGYEKNGVEHSASLVDLSLNLPLVVEFFDEPDKITTIIEHLKNMIEAEHIVFWPASVAQ